MQEILLYSGTRQDSLSTIGKSQKKDTQKLSWGNLWSFSKSSFGGSSQAMFVFCGRLANFRKKIKIKMDMCCCPLGYTKIISWYYSNIIVVQFAILNYIVVHDNNIIVYYNLPILFTGPIRLILWSSGRPPPMFKYVPITIMLTIEIRIVVRPSEQNLLSINLLFTRYFLN